MKIAKIETKNVGSAFVKLNEEYKELISADTTKKSEMISEGADLIQSIFSLWFKLGYTKEEIESHLKLHYQKLEMRNEEGRIKIDEWIEV